MISVFHQRRQIASEYLRDWELTPNDTISRCELIFGDNASTDGTRDLLRSWKHPSVRVDFLNENLGFARANNRLARSARAQVLLFLNNDVRLTPGWLDPILAAFAGRPELGIVGNVQLSVRARAVDHAGIFFEPSGTSFHFRPLLRDLAGIDLLPVPAVTGACLAIRRELFEQIGGFHEGYVNGHEDLDLCLEARRRGYGVVVATKSVLWHYIGASPGRQNRASENSGLFNRRQGEQARALSSYAPPDLAGPPTDSLVPAHEPLAGSDTVSVYYDFGDGFSEAGSSVHLINRGRWNRMEIDLCDLHNRPAIRLRLDPGQSPGRFRFSGLGLVHGDNGSSGELVSAARLLSVAEIGGTARQIGSRRGVELESTGDDPQVTVDLRQAFRSVPDQARAKFWLWADARPPTDRATSKPQTRISSAWVQKSGPTRVLVDLVRLSPGGVNGGIKIFAAELLDAIAGAHGSGIELHVMAVPGVCSEFARDGRRFAMHPTTGDDGPSRDLVRSADVLYAPLGYSSLSTPGLPQVTLFVDFLHRDIDGALPVEEVAVREKWMVESISRSAAIQCNSLFVTDRLHYHYGRPRARAFVIYNAVGASRPAQRHAQQVSNAPYFFYPANDWPHKNHDVLLEAYAAYRRDSRAPWLLKLTGHFADSERIARSIARLGLSDSVAVLGHLGRSEFVSTFERAGALVFPSRHEGFGIPILEAFRLRVPVVCSRAASLPEVGGDACEYFDPENTASCAEALARVANGAELRARLIARGSQRASAFRLDQEAAKLARIFVQVAGERSW